MPLSSSASSGTSLQFEGGEQQKILTEEAQLRSGWNKDVTAQQSAPVQPQQPANTVKLSNGDLIDKSAFDKLSPTDQASLMKLGVSAFNAQQNAQVQQFQANNIKLDDGTFVAKTDFNKLSPADQVSLIKLGVTGFNAQQNQANQIAQQTFLANNVKLSDGTYVAKTDFSKLSASDQALLMKLGVSGFNAYQTQLSQPSPAQQAALSVLIAGGFVTNNSDGSYTISLTNINGSIADVATIQRAFPQTVSQNNVTALSSPTNGNIAALGVLQAIPNIYNNGTYNLEAALSAGVDQSTLLRAGFNQSDINLAAFTVQHQNIIATQAQNLQNQIIAAELAPYTTGGQVNIVQAIQGGVPEASIKTLGVTQDTINAIKTELATPTAVTTAAPVTAQQNAQIQSNQGYMSILNNPANGLVLGKDSQGNVIYDIGKALRQGNLTSSDLTSLGYDNTAVQTYVIMNNPANGLITSTGYDFAKAIQNKNITDSDLIAIGFKQSDVDKLHQIVNAQQDLSNYKITVVAPYTESYSESHPSAQPSTPQYNIRAYLADNSYSPKAVSNLVTVGYSSIAIPAIAAMKGQDATTYLKNNPTQQAVDTLANAGYNAAVVVAAQKVVDGVNQAITNIPSVLSTSKSMSPQVESLLSSIQEAGYYNVGLNGVTAKPITDSSGNTTILYIGKDGKALTDTDITNIQWNNLTQQQQEQVANLYAQDLFKGNYFAEYTNQMSKAANEAGLVGQIAFSPVLSIFMPIAKVSTNQKVSAGETAGAVVTGIVDVATMGEASGVIDAVGAIGKTVVGGALVTAGVINAPNVIAADINPNVSLGQKILATGGEVALLGGGAFGISRAGVEAGELGTVAKSAESIEGKTTESITPLEQAINTERIATTTSNLQGSVARAGTIISNLGDVPAETAQKMAILYSNLGDVADKLTDTYANIATYLRQDLPVSISSKLIDASQAIENTIDKIQAGWDYVNSPIFAQQAMQTAIDLANKTVTNAGNALAVATKYIAETAPDKAIAIAQSTISKGFDAINNAGEIFSKVTQNIAENYPDAVINGVQNIANQVNMGFISAGEGLARVTQLIAENYPDAVMDTVNKIYTSALQGVDNAGEALTIATKYIAETAPENIIRTAENVASNVGKVSVDLFTDVQTGLSDIKTNLDDAVTYLSKDGYNDARLVIENASKSISELSSQITANTGKLSVDTINNMQASVDSIKITLADVTNYLKTNAYDDAVMTLKSASQDLQDRVAYYKLAAETTAQEFKLGVQSAKLSQALNDALDKVKTEDDFYELRNSEWYKNTLQQYQELLDQRIQYYETQLEQLTPLANRISALELGTEDAVRKSLLSDYIDKLEYVKNIQLMINYQDLTDRLDAFNKMSVTGDVDPAIKQTLLAQAKVILDNQDATKSDLSTNAVTNLDKLFDSIESTPEALNDVEIQQKLADMRKMLADIANKEATESTVKDTVDFLKSALKSDKTKTSFAINDVESFLKNTDIENRTEILANQDLISEIKDYLNNPQIINDDRLQSIIERLKNNSSDIGITPEQQALWQRISDDTNSLNKLMDNTVDAEPEIAKLTARIQENMNKLSEIGDKELSKISDAIDTKLQELGYNEQDIATLTDKEKLDIVSNNKPPISLSFLDEPETPPETSGGGKTPTETTPEPSSENTPEQEPQRESEPQKETSVATEVKPETKVEEETVTKTPEELEEMMKDKEPVKEMQPESKPETSRQPSTTTMPQIQQPEGEPYWTWVWENGAVVFKQVTPQKLQQLIMTQELDDEKALEAQRERDAAEQLAQRLGISVTKALEMIQNGVQQLIVPSQVQQMNKVQTMEQVMAKEPQPQPQPEQIPAPNLVKSPDMVKIQQPDVVKIHQPDVVKIPQPDVNKIPQPDTNKPPVIATDTKIIPPPVIVTPLNITTTDIPDEWKKKGVPKGTVCFPKGTKILVAKDIKRKCRWGGTYVQNNIPLPKNIEDVTIGDKVLSYNEITARKELKVVVNVIKRQSPDILLFKFSNGNQLRCTPEHPIASVDGGGIKWVEAKNVTFNDKIIQYNYVGLHRRLECLDSNKQKDKNELTVSKRRGKLLEEIFGGERANKIKLEVSLANKGRSSFQKGKTLEELYGKEKSDLIKGKESVKSKGNKRRLGKHHTEETKRKLSENHRDMSGDKNPFYGKHHTEELKNSLREKTRIMATDPNSLMYINRTNAVKQYFKDNPEFGWKQGKRLCMDVHARPNKSEKRLSYILRKLVPSEYKYNGDCRLGITIGGMIPDFWNVNGKKKVIEFFGSYWHSEDETPKKIAKYKEFGVDCLIIWDYEMKDKEAVKNKILTFTHNPNIELVNVVSIEKCESKSQDVYNLTVADNNNYFAYGILVHNCYRQGMKWIVIPPPYRDEDKLYLSHPPPGVTKFATGKGSAYKTLQVIGGKPEKDVDIDVGWANIHISTKGALKMSFKGGKEAVNERWASEKERMEEYDKQSYEDLPQESVRGRVAKAIPPNGLGKVLLPQYSTRKLKIYAINDDFIRDNFVDTVIGTDGRAGIDWGQGGHHWIFPMIPEDEIWVGRSLSPSDRPKFILHEIAEREKMMKGMDYSTAHNDYANEVETKARLHPEDIRGMLEEALAKYKPKQKVKVPQEVYNDESDTVVVPSYVRRKKGVVAKQTQQNDEEAIAPRYYLGRKEKIVASIMPT